ncbi:MAG TPA: carbohydrate ABC transporter permease [Bacteroidota bacterium]
MKTIGRYLLLVAGAVVFAYPFLWMIAGALKPESEIHNLALWSSTWSMSSILKVFTRVPLARSFFNSVVVSGLTTLSVIVFGSMVGYALAKLNFRGKSILYALILFTMMIPFQLTLIPQYILMVKLGFTDTYMGLIAPTMMSALSIVIFRQFFLEVPNALLDAARLDGCSEFTILFRLIWPLARPTVLTVAILTFMTSWNEVLWPLIVVRDRAMMTMPQLVTIFVTGGEAETQLGVQLAAATFLALPVITLYAFFQRYFIESMVSTGLKG